MNTDCISRQAVIDLMMQKWGENFSGDDAMQESIDAIRVMPSVTPQLTSELEKNSQKLEKDFGELDCISRADAIRVASGYCHPSNVAKELAKLPSVAPQEPRWIPVSERMPEDGQFVLFCDIDDDSMVGYHVKGRPNTHFLQVGIFEDMKNVRAWMPLPKPYEPQGSEE